MQGLKTNRVKPEYLWFNIEWDVGEVKMDEEVIKGVQSFNYLGSQMTVLGENRTETNHLIQCGWNTCRRVIAVICD